MKHQPEFEATILKLYRIKNPTERVKRLVDDLALEVIGESYAWPKAKS